MEAVNKSMVKGAFWMILLRLVVRGIGLISTVILARLLLPADFGLIAMAMTFIAAFELMGAFSLDVVLIQNRDARRSHYDTAWTFNVIAAALQALILIFIAPLIADFYNDSRLIMVVYLLALGVLVQGFENIGIVAFRKDLEFHKDFKFQIATKLFAFTVTMGLAFWLRSYWALIGGMLASKFMGVAFSYVVHSYRPKFSVAARSELFHFSKWLFINNLLFFANHQSANFILGRIAGPHALGLFTLSYEISNLPSTDLVAPINRAIFPGYAKMAKDLAVLRQGFLNVISAIALISLPVCIGIALTAEPLVYVLLGERWRDAVPLIQVLAIAGLFAALQTNKGAVYLAMGRPRIMTLLAGIHVATLIPALLWGTMRNGVVGAAEATVIVSALLLPLNYAVLFRVISLPLPKFVEVLWRPLVSAGVMALAVKATLEFLPTGNFPAYLTQLILATIAGGASYMGSIVILWKLTGMEPGVEGLLLSKFANHFKSLFAKG